MSQKVRIPFTFVVTKVTWRPAGEALPEAPQGSVLTGLDGQVLPLGAEIFPEPGVLDALTEQGKREYYEEEAAAAGESRRQAREAEEARREPVPISGGASRLTASLYGNLRRPRQPAASAEPASAAGSAAALPSGSSNLVSSEVAPTATPAPASAPTSATNSSTPNRTTAETSDDSSLSSPNDGPPAQFSSSSSATTAGGCTRSDPPASNARDDIASALLRQGSADTPGTASKPRAADAGLILQTALTSRSDRQDDRQGASPDRPIIPVQEDEELAGPAVVAAKQLRDKLQSDFDEMNVLELDGILDQLPQSERKAVNTIENVIENGTY